MGIVQSFSCIQNTILVYDNPLALPDYLDTKCPSQRDSSSCESHGYSPALSWNAIKANLSDGQKKLVIEEGRTPNCTFAISLKSAYLPGIEVVF